MGNRRTGAWIVVALLALHGAAWAADAKKAVTLDAGLASPYRAGEVYNGTIAAQASDSTRSINATGYKYLKVQLYVRGSTAASFSQPHRIAFQARDIACWDSASVVTSLRGYPAGDTGQKIGRPLPSADVLAAITDTMCMNPWNPVGIRRTGTAYTDTTEIGTNDTTLVSTAKLQPNELLIELPPRRANQGTTSMLFMQPAIYEFWIADLNGLFWRGNNVTLRFRNLSVGSVDIRCRLQMYKD